MGIQHSPSFVGESQCNRVIDRFMRTLNEQCLWLHRFTDLAHAERRIAAFIERYNAECSSNVTGIARRVGSARRCRRSLPRVLSTGRP